MASAAAAKKCQRPFQPGSSAPTSLRYASWTRAVAWSVWPSPVRELRAAKALASSS